MFNKLRKLLRPSNNTKYYNIEIISTSLCSLFDILDYEYEKLKFLIINNEASIQIASNCYKTRRAIKDKTAVINTVRSALLYSKIIDEDTKEIFIIDSEYNKFVMHRVTKYYKINFKEGTVDEIN